MLGILGYTDRWLVAPGDVVAVRLSSRFPQVYARLVRHEGAVRMPADWSRATSDAGVALQGPVFAQERLLPWGSCLAVETPDGPQVPLALAFDLLVSRLAERNVLAWLDGGPQVTLLADLDGRFAVEIDGAAQPLPGLDAVPGRWHRVVLRLSGGEVEVALRQRGGVVVTATAPLPTPAKRLAGFALGGKPISGQAKGALDGTVGGIVLLGAASPAAGLLDAAREGALASWDLGGHDQSAMLVHERHGRQPPMRLLGAPTRGVRGAAWDGRARRPGEDAASHDAVRLHRDDLSDAGWPADLSIALPADLPSGAYAVILSRDADPDWDDRESFDAVPLFVRPRAAAARVALVLPTFSYRAYANGTFFEGRNPDVFRLSRETGSKPIYDTVNALGLASLYDRHADGSGRHLATLRRPQATIRADFENQLQGFPHQYSADLEIVEWLSRHGIAFDLLTDEALHEEGAGVLSAYDAVLTGSHPEYASPQSLDAYHGYLAGGGSLLYLGGNGFYWSVAVGAADPALLEVRRRGGGRTWTVAPGEAHHQLDGREGGVWRLLDRPPNLLVGLGFACTGFVGDGRYQVEPEALRAPLPPRISEALAAIGEAAFGVAGLELDRFDTSLGSSSDLVVLARAVGLPQGYHPAVEEVETLDLLLPDPLAAMDKRAVGDIVWGPLHGGGTVFAVGSIRWTSGLNLSGDPWHVDRLTIAALLTALESVEGQP